MSRILVFIVLAVVAACASAQYHGASPYNVGVDRRSPYAAPLAYSAGYRTVGSPLEYSDPVYYG